MKPHTIIFIATLGMLASIVAAVVIGEAPDGHGIDHPRFETMSAGGSGIDRHTIAMGPAWVFAAFHVLFCISVLAMGMMKRGGIGRVKYVLMGGGAVFLAIFFGLFFSYRNFMHGATDEFFLGVPTPTAWMLFGVWLFPIFFIALYVVVFRPYYLMEEEERYFAKIVEWRRAQDAKAAKASSEQS